LPKSFDMTPFWSEVERSELDDTLQQTTRKLKVQVEQDFTAATTGNPAASALAKKYQITLDEFRWAKAVLWSRCSDLKGPDGKQMRILIPGFDLANHDPTLPPCHSVQGDKIVVKATKAYEVGDEFNLNYGPHENSHLLMWYGFALEENLNHSICFEFPVAKMYAVRLQELGARVKPNDKDAEKVIAGCLVTCAEPLPKAMVFAAAICNDVAGLDEDELNLAQEVAALDLLTKILPPRPDLAPLPDPSNLRKRYSAILRTVDDRLLFAFHDALNARKKALLPKPKSSRILEA